AGALSGVLQRLPTDLEELALLRVHRVGLDRGDPEEACVEGSDVTLQEVALPDVDLSASSGGRVVVLLRRPAVLGDLPDPAPVIEQEGPVPFGGVATAGGTASHADHGDRLVGGPGDLLQALAHGLCPQDGLLQQRAGRALSRFAHATPSSAIILNSISFSSRATSSRSSIASSSVIRARTPGSASGSRASANASGPGSTPVPGSSTCEVGEPLEAPSCSAFSMPRTRLVFCAVPLTTTTCDWSRATAERRASQPSSASRGAAPNRLFIMARTGSPTVSLPSRQKDQFTERVRPRRSPRSHSRSRYSANASR